LNFKKLAQMKDKFDDRLLKISLSILF
jgi:hypothetical protein